MHNGVSLSGGFLPLGPSELLVDLCIARWKSYKRGKRCLELTASGHHLLQRHGARKLADALLASRDMQQLLREQNQPLGKTTLIIDGMTHIVSMHHNENPLSWLARHRDRFGNPFLSQNELQAGERFRADVTCAQLLPNVTVRWDGVSSQSSYNPKDSDSLSERMVAAKQRLNKAVEAVGSDFGSLLIDICGFLKGLETVERERHWPPRSGKTIFKIALGKLADHYGLKQRAIGPARSRGIFVAHF